MPNQIARGTTGTVYCPVNDQPGQPGDVEEWVLAPTGFTNTNAGGYTVAIDSYQTGAGVIEGAFVSISVPNSVANAPLGLATVRYVIDIDGAQFVFGGGFEVMCMTARITTTETYRDETVYRLSCTATLQGGTAPYTYSWSSNVPGSRAIGATDQATLEVEIPVNAGGTIAVEVTDSGTPPCIVSVGFDVCGHVTCDFSTALISTPPAGQTGPYKYECRSSSQSAFGPLAHEWAPDPVWVSEDGAVARFSFPDDDEYSIHLSVTDTTGCRAFKTRRVGGYEFIVSTDPSGEDTGTIRGTRGAMEFEVMVKAEATRNFTGPPPAQLTFELFRPAINSEAIVVGDLVAGSSPPRYEFLWLVRQEKGRWQIKLRGYRSNTVGFKIDKRKQIVEVANSWVGATGLPGCDEFVGIVYNHLGLSLPSNGTGAQYAAASDACAGDGCILFYFSEMGGVAHDAIRVGTERLDVNSNTSTPDNNTEVRRDDITAGVTTGANNPYTQYEARSIRGLDED